MIDEELLQHQDKLVRQHEELSKVSIVKPAYIQLSKEEYLKLVDYVPNFGMYRENYIISGVPTNKAVSKNTADSRSWNYLTLSLTYFFNLQLSGQIKIWPGILDSDNNKDLYDYRGYGLIALNYRGLKDRIKFSMVLNPRKKFTSVNTQMDFSFRLSKKSNQYLFLQWYNGYGEGLLNYNKYTSMVRIGISLRPDMLIFY